MSPETRRIRGADARQLLDNKLLKEAFESVAKYVDDQAMTCSPDDAVRAQRIIISKQLLAAIKREITRVIEDGELAKIEISEIERRGRMRLFQR
jgi:hypothetical protein